MSNKTCFNCLYKECEEDGCVTECSCPPFNDEQACLAEECEWDEIIMPTICGFWDERDEHQDNAIG